MKSSTKILLSFALLLYVSKIILIFRTSHASFLHHSHNLHELKEGMDSSSFYEAFDILLNLNQATSGEVKIHSFCFFDFTLIIDPT